MTGNDIYRAARLLREGQVVAIPTETVYGLAANAYDPDAVLRIFEIKNRPRFNPLIVHIGSIEMLDDIASSVPEVLQNLARHFWPGPLTILVPRSEKIHDIVTAGSDLVAVRMPDHVLTLALLHELDFPIAAPSANEFGKISPTTAQHVASQLGEKISYILDGGPSAIGVESTILKYEHGKIIILRPGAITAQQIFDVTGEMPENPGSDNPIEAPGMLKSHYAPNVPMLLGDFHRLVEGIENKKIGVISFSNYKNHPSIVGQYVLSASGDLHEAARNLFAAMHEIEESGAELIIVEPVPDEGIGIAINDRLKKASTSADDPE